MPEALVTDRSKISVLPGSVLLPARCVAKGYISGRGARPVQRPDASELGHEAWLASNLGKPYGNAGFGNVFKDWCKEAGLPQCHCHGLRKIGAVRAAEAGASEHELMAMFGWEDADMARVYTRKAAQKKLAVSGAANVAHRVPIAPPAGIVRKNSALEAGWWTQQGTDNEAESED